MFWLVFIGALALQFAGYAAYRGLRAYGARLQLAEDMEATRPLNRSLGRYIGGHDRVGE